MILYCYFQATSLAEGSQSFGTNFGGREEEGGDVLALPAEQHGARRTSAKLKGITAVISNRLAGESPSPQ
jgi:hypothetical protein